MSSQSSAPTPYSPLPTPRSEATVFVYGTLKQGQRNHDRFCLGLISVQEATVRGWLYDLPYGFPALVVPEMDVRATGTTDYLADTHVQNRTQVVQESSFGPTVHGELLSFDDPEERLPSLDALEGFRPGEEGFYERVLVPVKLSDMGTTIPAWTYVIESAFGIHLPGGHWPAP